jgi:MYXO-CTERM domain-containing protein
VFRDDTWGNFDTSGSDSVLSAPFTAGGDFGTTCPPPGDAAYGVLTEGHQCLQVTIADNGPNDKDPAGGTISDPSGLGSAPAAEQEDKRKSGDSGCTIASAHVNPSQGGAWWLLGGLLTFLGWRRRKPPQH